MFNLDKAIQNWRKKLERHPGLEPGYIEELEAHLRDKIEVLLGQGLSEEEAFSKSLEQFESAEALAEEFHQSRATTSKKPAWKSSSWIPALLPSFIKTFLRNFWRQKAVTSINILGLAAGVACCIFIFLYVWDELNYDAFHSKGDRIFRVAEDFQSSGSYSHIAIVENALGPVAQKEIPGVKKAVRLYTAWRLTAGPVESAQIVRDYFVTDSTFFSVFDFPLKWGDENTALTLPGSVILTEELSEKLFGDTDPTGKSIRIEAEDFPEFGTSGFTVTGVMKQIPENSHLKFELLLSRSTISRFEEWESFFDSWDGYFAATYLLLNEPGNRKKVEEELKRVITKYRGEETAEQKSVYLQPLSDIHFYSADISYENNAEEGQLSYIYLFSLIALVILAIACINYMNLTTARSIFRAKEIGLRKTAGAHRTQLIAQFIGESVFTAITALILSLIILLIALPYFNLLAGKQITPDIILSVPFISSMLLLALVIGVGAGLYPAMFLSRFKPSEVLKGTFKTDNSLLRKGLVVVQFTLSIVMISATIIAYSQMQFIQQKNLGFDEEQIMVVDINHDDIQINFMTVKEELLQNPVIEHVAVSSRVPADWKAFRQIEVNLPAEDSENAREMYFNTVDEDFLDTYDIMLSQGRNFQRERASDTAAVILNHTAADLLFEGDAVGQILTVNENAFNGQVIGVVDDFHYHSLHERIQPLVIGFISPEGSHPIHGIDYFSIKAKGSNIEQAIAHTREVHKQFDPVNPVEYAFLNQWIRDQYEQDSVISRLFAIAAGLAIIIACIGLFGLTTFFAERRTKEIGIRKVLGATVLSVITLLSKDYLKLIGIAFIISVPVTWYAGQQWLENFAYRVDIGIGLFLVSGAISVFIALLAVSGQSFKAATVNPVKSLRSE